MERSKKVVSVPSPINAPWVGQEGYGKDKYTGDCGLGCLASESNRRGIYYGSVDALGDIADKSQTDGRIGFNALSKEEIIRVALTLGIRPVNVRNWSYESLRQDLNNGIAFMALGHYHALPKRQYPNDPTIRGHFVYVVYADDHIVILHDPCWKYEKDGAFVQMTKAQFMNFWIKAELDDNRPKGGLRLF